MNAWREQEAQWKLILFRVNFIDSRFVFFFFLNSWYESVRIKMDYRKRENNRNTKNVKIKTNHTIIIILNWVRAVKIILWFTFILNFFWSHFYFDFFDVSILFFKKFCLIFILNYWLRRFYFVLDGGASVISIEAIGPTNTHRNFPNGWSVCDENLVRFIELFSQLILMYLLSRQFSCAVFMFTGFSKVFLLSPLLPQIEVTNTSNCNRREEKHFFFIHTMWYWQLTLSIVFEQNLCSKITEGVNFHMSNRLRLDAPLNVNKGIGTISSHRWITAHLPLCCIVYRIQ